MSSVYVVKAVVGANSPLSKRVLLALLLSVCGLCPSAGSDFSGTWKLLAIRTGQTTTSLTEIQQTETTVALRPVLPGQSTGQWSIFPTNGNVISEQRRGHRATRRSARWSQDTLILETSGAGCARW